MPRALKVFLGIKELLAVGGQKVRRESEDHLDYHDLDRQGHQGHLLDNDQGPLEILESAEVTELPEIAVILVPRDGKGEKGTRDFKGTRGPKELTVIAEILVPLGTLGHPVPWGAGHDVRGR